MLVVFPAGLDFLCSFFGCLYAGAIAVPTRYPHPRRPLTHLKKIAADSGATLGLTTREMQPILAEALGEVRWLAAADVELSRAGSWEDPVSGGDDIAYLQYTSGSTASPKGVVIRHRHVLANCEELRSRWGMGAESRILSWLPHFHDMGLVFGLIESLYVGCPGVFMPPMAFVQRPSFWLEAISRERITHSAAPNFAYEICSRIPAAQLEGLDLSGWRVATNGAEQVRADTIERFTRRYEPYGFSPHALCPGYGLAENTLMATSSRPGRPPVVLTVQAEKLREGKFETTENGRGTPLVSSGGTDVETQIIIADPASRTRCPAGEVGEIWLAGPSVAGGYWQRPDLSAQKFEARLADTGEGPFLRTGDLGALHDGELFVLGRMDDLIIIRGANHHPDDLELTVAESDAALQPDGGAAFTVELLGEPRLVVAHEIQRQALRRLDAGRTFRAILAAVSERHELEVSAVVLLKPHSLPRTHSGKKQRKECRQRFLDGTLQGVETWLAPKLRDAFTSGLAGSFKVAPASAATTTGARAETLSRESVSEGGRVMESKSSVDKTDELLGWLREYAGERINSRLMDERRSIPPYVVLDLGNHGVLGMLAPERYGGLGLDNRGLSRVLQQLAAIDLTLGSFVSVNNALGIRPILLYATEEKREELLPILATGRELAAFAVTEPGAGSNVRGIAAAGRPDPGGGWRLWGTKYWSGSASWAGVINTFVQLEGEGPESASRGVTGFVLRQGSPGLRMGAEALTMGLRGMVQNEVLLEGVRVSSTDLLGEVGEGMNAAMDSMEFGRFCLSSLSLGVMKRCLQLMVRHAGRRSISTGKLLDNPVTLIRIGDLTAAVEAVEALLALVGERLDEGARVPAEVFCACKTAGPEFAWRAADHLVQQMAGRGYIETNLAPQILRDARILRIFEGPTEPMNVHVGSKLIHSPEGLRSFVADELRQPTIAAELTVAAARIWERCLGSGSPFGDRSAAHTWAYSLAGEVATYGILLAALKYRIQSSGPSARLRRAEEWTRLRFDRRLAKALGNTPAEAVFLESAQLEELVAGYAADIGDVEQTLAGERHQLDRLVRRDGEAFGKEDISQASGEVAPPKLVETAHAERAEHGERKEHAASERTTARQSAVDTNGEAAPSSTDFSEWMVRWVAEEFRQPAGSVTPTDRFSEYGMDSVTAVKLMNALEGRLGVDLPTTLVWDYPTIAELATYLAGLAAPSPRKPVAAAAAPAVVASGERCAIAADKGETAQDELKMLARLDDFSEEELRALLKQFPEV